ncbi:hypothetical protein JTB14_035863 [Gonioctena quinquepunctata]|nr:hypothetical protein JTB14_035863 [Gonioctena quinquepunctata]
MNLFHVQLPDDIALASARMVLRAGFSVFGLKQNISSAPRIPDVRRGPGGGRRQEQEEHLHKHLHGCQRLRRMAAVCISVRASPRTCRFAEGSYPNARTFDADDEEL